jgi:hypothetical protein
MKKPIYRTKGTGAVSARERKMAAAAIPRRSSATSNGVAVRRAGKVMTNIRKGLR